MIATAPAADRDPSPWRLDGELPRLTLRKEAGGRTAIIALFSKRKAVVPQTTMRPCMDVPIDHESTRPMAMLEAQDISARRGLTRLFAGLSFTVQAGEALVITGANGTGKTTLLRMLAGLSAPASGTISWRGQPLRPFDPTLRSALAFAGHLPALKDELTAEENLSSLVALSQVDADPERVRAALDEVALGRQRHLPARVLSQGQRRRIGLARLALLNRMLWLLDEPMTSLDAAGAALLARLIGEHVGHGGIAVAATHTAIDLADARVRTLALS